MLLISIVWASNASRENIIKPIGEIYFTDNEHLLNFDINLKGYFANALTLNNNTQILEEKCQRNPNITDCEFFEKKFKSIADLAERETRYIKLGRQKRELICMAVALIITAIGTSIAGFVAGAAYANSAQDDLIKQSNTYHETLMRNLLTTEKNLKTENKTLVKLIDSIHNLQKNASEREQISRLLTTSLLAIDRHNKDTEKYINALGKELVPKFFSIVDIKTFLDALQNIQRKLPYDSPVLLLKPSEILRISFIQSELLGEKIQITLRIPMISREKYTLSTLTPIPVTRDNTSFILNTDTKYIIKNETTVGEIPISTLSQCIQTANLTICGSSLSREVLELNDCTRALIENKTTTALCTYRVLPTKNQLIHISDSSIYAYIVSPIRLKISCGLSTNIINLNDSTEIDFQRECKVVQISNEIQPDYTSTTVNIESTLIKPNFAVFENGNWSEDIEFLNQFDIEIQNLFWESRETRLKFEKHSKISEIPLAQPRNLLEALCDIFTRNIILYGVLPLAIILIISCCVCYHKK